MLFEYGRRTSRVIEIEASRLVSRAWACQERLLSSRIIHFTEKQLFWECWEMIASQDGLNRRYDLLHLVPSLISTLFHEHTWRRDNHVVETWYQDIVRRTYSKRESTVESDKLLAISALAELWSKQVKSLYLAGLWQLDIHLGLAWHRDTPFSICRPQNYRNPSWSWAALDCEPVWDWGIHSAYVEPRIQFLEAKIDIGQNPFDRVTGGYIKVVEQMRAFKIEPYRNGAPWNTMRTMDRKEMGYGISAWMDQAQDVQGLLLYEVEEPSDQGDLFRILLLAPNPSDPQQYSRKGLAFVDPSDGLKTLFDGCEKPIITLI